MLAEQVALVTGAGHGIGRAIALALSEAGARVAAVDIDAAAAQATASAARGGLALAADVGEVAEIDKMVGQVVDTFGRLDILINNAGVTRRASIMDLTEADWDRILRVNA